MSYDLRIAPRVTGAPLPSVAFVGAAIQRAGGHDQGDGLHFLLTDPNSGEVTVDVSVVPEGVTSIEVSTSFSTDPPATVYRLCSSVAAALSWQVFDPQGGDWFEPEDLESATTSSRGLSFALPPIATALSGLAFFMAMLVWLFKGHSFRSPWFPLVFATCAALCVARIRDMRRGMGISR